MFKLFEMQLVIHFLQAFEEHIRWLLQPSAMGASAGSSEKKAKVRVLKSTTSVPNPSSKIVTKKDTRKGKNDTKDKSNFFIINE